MGTAADLQLFLSQNHPETDSGTAGGAIDLTMRPMIRTGADLINSGDGDLIDLVSDSASDTQQCYLGGIDPDGAWVSETVTLAGLSHVQSVNTYMDLRIVRLASAAVGEVTVAAYASGSPVAIFAIPATERGRACLFPRSQGAAAGGGTSYFYAKLFLRNCNGADAFQAVKVWLSEDEDGEYTMDLEMSGGATVTGGSETTTNRRTAPTTGGSYSWGEHASEGAAHAVGDDEDGNLTGEEAQGIWVRRAIAEDGTAEAEVNWAISWSGAAA